MRVNSKDKAKGTVRRLCLCIASSQGCLGGDLLGGCERGLSLCGESGEAGGIGDGDLGEDLAIEAVACLLEAVDEGGVAHAVDAAGCVDTDDPERAVLTLLLFTAGVGELESALDGFLSSLV